MHVILGILSSIVAILYALDRLGIDLGGLNPFYWYRRRAFAKKYPVSRTGRSDALSREESAASLLSEAKGRLKQSKLLYSGLRQLVGIRTRWPDTPNSG